MQRLVGLLLFAIVAFCIPAAAQFNGCAPGICNTNPQTTNFPLPGIVPNGVDCYLSRGLYYPSQTGCALTVVRASTGTAFDTSGNLYSFANNVARLTNQGLLTEETRTNLLLWSQAPGANPSTWPNSGATPPTVTDNAITSPDGTMDASSWVRNINTSSFTAQVLTKAASALPYTYFTCFKMNVSRYAAVRMQGVFPNRADVVFDLQGGVIASAATASGTFTSASATMTPVAQGFYCTTLTATTDTATSITNAISFNGNAGPIDVTSALPQSGYWFGNQLEQASFGTSYFPTTSAAGVRAADVIKLTTPPVFGTAVSLFAAMTPGAPLTASAAQGVGNINDGTSSNDLVIFRTAAGAASATSNSGGMSQYAVVGNPWNQSTLGKIMLSATAGAYNSAFDGTALTPGAGALLPPGLSTVSIGNNALGVSQCNCYLSRFAVWPTTAQPTAVVQSLTNLNQWN